MRALRASWCPGVMGALLFLALLCAPALAGPGKIAGKIQDASTGEALAGANVATEVGGIPVGAVADDEGRYFILNVPPGQYSVTASMVGYRAMEQTEVEVGTDLTTTLDFSMATQAVQVGAVTVVAERPPIEPSLTSTRSTISAVEFDNTMPVAGVEDLINTTPSAFNGFIRGGRKSESRILIDGIDVSDTYFSSGEGSGVSSAYYNATRSNGTEFGAVGVNTSAIQSMDIITGTFNAEYDAASAGIINIVGKEGGQEFEGRLYIRQALTTLQNAGPDLYNDFDSAPCEESYCGNYIAERDKLAASSNANNQKKAELYTFSQETIDEIGYGDDRPFEMELSLGGPLTSRGGFYFTGRFENSHGQFANELHRVGRYTLKLTHSPVDNIKLTGNVMIEDGGGLGGWVNRDFDGANKYLPTAMVGNKKMGVMAYVGLTHMLSPNTFYEIKISQLNRTSEFGHSDDDGDGIPNEDGEDGDFIVLRDVADVDFYLGASGKGTRSDGTEAFFTSDPGSGAYKATFNGRTYRVAHPGFYYEELQRNVTQLKADITSQVNYNHQVKSGIQLRLHDVSTFRQFNQLDLGFSQDMNFEEKDWSLSPKEYGIYVQDRIEYEGLIINAGLRLDGFDVAADLFTDMYFPSEQVTRDNGMVVREDRRSIAVDTKWYVQPRLGVSHPISENAAMYYSWGRFYSPRAFSQLYDQYGSFTNPSYPRVNDLDMDPYVSTAYEIGMQYGFRQNYLLDLTAYYRDVDNYGSFQYAINPGDGQGFGTYGYSTSFGTADSRGIEASLERQATHGLSWRANYAFSYVKQSIWSDDTPFPDKKNYSAAAESDYARDIQEDLEDRYTFNRYERNVTGGGNPLTSGYDRTHRMSLALMATLPAQIKASLIGNAQSGFIYAVTQTSTDPRDRETDVSPWSYRLDLRLARSFKLGGQSLGAFIEARNLLDKENIIAYHTDQNGQRMFEEDHDPAGRYNQAWVGGQSVYDTPREVNLGLTLDF